MLSSVERGLLKSELKLTSYWEKTRHFLSFLQHRVRFSNMFARL